MNPLPTSGNLALKWVKEYFGTIQFDPNKELACIPAHSSFFILSPDNRSVCMGDGIGRG